MFHASFSCLSVSLHILSQLAIAMPLRSWSRRTTAITCCSRSLEPVRCVDVTFSPARGRYTIDVTFLIDCQCYDITVATPRGRPRRNGCAAPLDATSAPNNELVCRVTVMVPR